jgi:hypothetical protein
MAKKLAWLTTSTMRSCPPFFQPKSRAPERNRPQQPTMAKKLALLTPSTMRRCPPFSNLSPEHQREAVRRNLQWRKSWLERIEARDQSHIPSGRTHTGTVREGVDGVPHKEGRVLVWAWMQTSRRRPRQRQTRVLPGFFAQIMTKTKQGKSTD